MRVPVNVFYIEDTVRLILSRRVAKLRTVEILVLVKCVVVQ